MIVGVIGPEVSLRILKERSVRFAVRLVPLVYRDFRETIKLIEENERKCDALLFTGQTPYLYAASLLQPRVPWDFMPRNILSTMCALVKAGLRYKNRIQSVSMDGFDDEIIEEIREELRETKESVRLYNARFDIMAADYFQQVVQYHTENYRTGRADLCVTGLQKIYEKLQSLRIPSIKTGPNFSLLQQKLQFLLLKHQIIAAEKNLPAIVVFQPEFQVSGEIHMYNELQMLRLQAQIGEAIYCFARRLGGATFQAGTARYYVVCNLKMLMAETSDLTELSLLHASFRNPCLTKISAGIGLGHTAREARYTADKALQRSRKSQTSCCYGLDEKGHFWGPIALSADPGEKEPFNKNLREISLQTGIGIRSLSKIEQALLQYQTDTITPSELARSCSLSLRSMNRLLQKLEEYRYLTVLGKEPQPAAGRPRRILRIDLRYHD